MGGNGADTFFVIAADSAVDLQTELLRDRQGDRAACAIQRPFGQRSAEDFCLAIDAVDSRQPFLRRHRSLGVERKIGGNAHRASQREAG